MSIENDTVLGVKSLTILWAFIGSAASLSYARELTTVGAVVALLVGMAVSVGGAPLALHYLNLGDSMERAVAFTLGLLAMRGVPVLFALLDRLRDIKLPWLKDPKE